MLSTAYLWIHRMFSHYHQLALALRLWLGSADAKHQQIRVKEKEGRYLFCLCFRLHLPLPLPTKALAMSVSLGRELFCQSPFAVSPSSLWTPVTTVLPCPLTRGGNSFALFPLFIPFNPAHISWNVSSVYHCSISKLLFLPI